MPSKKKMRKQDEKDEWKSWMAEFRDCVPESTDVSRHSKTLRRFLADFDQELSYADRLQFYNMDRVLLNLTLLDFDTGKTKSGGEFETFESIMNRQVPQFRESAETMMEAWRPFAEARYKNLLRAGVDKLLLIGTLVKDKSNELRYHALKLTQESLATELCKQHHVERVRPMLVKKLVANAIRNVLKAAKRESSVCKNKTLSKEKFNGVLENMPSIDREKEALRQERAKSERARRDALRAAREEGRHAVARPAAQPVAQPVALPRPPRDLDEKAASIAQAAKHAQNLRNQEEKRVEEQEALLQKRMLASLIIHGN